MTGVFANLRARYGLTSIEARVRLAALQKDARTALQEHASEVERLVEVAYQGMDADQRREMALETFASTLNNPSLQRHLLAVATPTLEAAVRAGSEYMQIRPSQNTSAIRVVDEEIGETDRVNPVTSETLMGNMMGVLQGLMSQLERLTTLSESNRPQKEADKTPKKCWGSHKEGHLRKDCPTHPWETEKPRGNEVGPQQ